MTTTRRRRTAAARPTPGDTHAPVNDWDEGTAAARSGDHERAVTHFRREAESRSAEGSHGRAAIAYRSAAVQAQNTAGGAAVRHQMMQEAAAAYAAVAHDDALPEAVTNEALRTAAMCYLQIGQLEAASHCIGEALGEPLELSEAS